MQTLLRKKVLSSPSTSTQTSKPVTGAVAESADVAQLQRTIGNRQTGMLLQAQMQTSPVQQTAEGGSRVQPKLRPSAAPSGGTIQRAVSEQEFDDATAAEVWYNTEKGELDANPLRITRLKKVTEYFLDAVESWKEYEAQAETVKECQKDLVDHYNLAVKLEGLHGMVQTQINGVNAKSAPLKAMVEVIKPTSWLRSYATREQTEKMNAIKDNYNPAIASRELYVQKLQTIQDTITNVTDLKGVKYSTIFTQVKTAAEKAKTEAPLSEINESYKEDGDKLKKDLEDQAKATIKAKLEAAKDDGAKQLDVEGAVDEIVPKIFAKQLPADVVDTLITNTLAYQHNPAKDVWLKKVLGLQAGLGGAYMKDIAKIDNKPTHVTRYENGIPDKPSVNTGPVTLKNDLLGNGVTAFHVTIETGGASDQKPHAYRGGITLTRWHLYPQTTSAFANAGDLQTALEGSLNHQVTQAEGAIDAARTNKGKGLQTAGVKNWLKN